MYKIRTNENTVYTEQQLLEIIHGSMDDVRFDNVVIMAGHFMLFYDSLAKQLVPGVFQDIASDTLQAQVKERVGIFPSYTWDLGIRLAEHYRLNYAKEPKLLLLINDWQYVPDSGSASEHRHIFYSQHQELPLSYAVRLELSTIISKSDLLPSRRHPHAFPETWLKNRFKNEAARLVKQGKLQRVYLTEHPGKSEISFTDAFGSTLPLISCGMTGCAGEITEMISEVHRAGGRYLIILAPAECHTPIRKGVEIALSLYELGKMKVLVADLGGSGEMTLGGIYSRDVNLVTFEA